MNPIWYRKAKSYVGTREGAGAANNKTVLAFYKRAGHGWVKEDALPWCAAFVGAMLEDSGIRSTRNLAARSYVDYGKPVARDKARIGDIVVFKRGRSSWQGHVGFYAGETRTHIKVLGGNQSNAVNIRSQAKSKLLAIRRPRTIGNSRTVKALGTSLGGTAITSGSDALPLVAETFGEAGGILQELAGWSDWIATAGVVLIVGGLAVGLWARLDDMKNAPERT